MINELPLTRYGATPDDWTHFDLILGLGEDLLPVVSNPDAEISSASKMKALGKTPSRYNNSKKVVGIPNWTSKQTNPKEIDQWASEPDYGICLQARTIRALDIDVPDHKQAKAITDFIATELEKRLPTRFRENSGKVLQAFSLPGDMPKRKLIVDGGMIEFLATGQQFIAIGTHPSGVRYAWDDGLPTEFPSLSLDAFEALWIALAERFAIAQSDVGTISMRQRGEHIALPDPVHDHLIKNKLILATDRDGAPLITCPWESEHTTGEAGDGSTCWFPAGTNGYERGNFVCLHGHCEGRGNAEFFEAIGYQENVIDDFKVLSPDDVSDSHLDGFERDKSGRALSTRGNVKRALIKHHTGVVIRHDEFKDQIVVSDDNTNWQPFRDTDYTRMCLKLENGALAFKPITREVIREIVHLAADNNRFDTAKLWIERLKWDGVPRIDRFMSVYFGTADTAYTRALGVYLWTSLAGRVVQPGVKADMVIILVGAQGTFKSTSVAALSPSVEFFTELSLHDSDDNLARKMRGSVVGEIPELTGLRTREIEAIKAFVTRTNEQWTPKYKEFTTSFQRRITMIGTTNQDEFLADETGNRRWLPAKVTHNCDPKLIEQDRDQLWAEGRERFNAEGIVYQIAEKLAEEEHSQYTIKDPWVDAISKWLDEPELLTDTKPLDKGYVTIGEVAEGGLRLDVRNLGKREEMRIGNSLRECNLLRVRRFVSGKQQRVWCDTRPPIDHLENGGGLAVPF